MTKRQRGEHYTEVKRVVGGAVTQTTCCCAAAGATPRGCAAVSGNRTPCRCACHPRRPR